MLLIINSRASQALRRHDARSARSTRKKEEEHHAPLGTLRLVLWIIKLRRVLPTPPPAHEESANRDGPLWPSRVCLLAGDLRAISDACRGGAAAPVLPDLLPGATTDRRKRHGLLSLRVGFPATS